MHKTAMTHKYDKINCLTKCTKLFKIMQYLQLTQVTISYALIAGISPHLCTFTALDKSELM